MVPVPRLVRASSTVLYKTNWHRGVADEDCPPWFDLENRKIGTTIRVTKLMSFTNYLRTTLYGYLLRLLLFLLTNYIQSGIRVETYITHWHSRVCIRSVVRTSHGRWEWGRDVITLTHVSRSTEGIPVHHSPSQLYVWVQGLRCEDYYTTNVLEIFQMRCCWDIYTLSRERTL